jgi:hypothetical protein
MLYFGTNEMYGLRSVGGHSFVAKSWQELFAPVATDTSTATQLRVEPRDLDVAQSPVLDRLAGRYYVASPYDLPFGVVELPPPAPSSVVIGEGDTATGTVAPGPLRAVIVDRVGRLAIDGTLAFVEATLRDETGQVVATGRRRYESRRKAAPIVIPLAPQVGTDRPLTVEIALRSNGRDRDRLAAFPDGRLAVGTVRPTGDDDLRLVYSDAGAVVYRRPAALPRIRWADQAVVERRGKRRVRRIAAGEIEPNTVVLDRPGPAADGRPARVEVLADETDHIRARVRADGAGYLVVADALQTDWRAALDGQSVPIRNADHALVAIHVPKGMHVVTLDAEPRGWRTGILVSIAAGIVLLALIAWGIVRRRRSRAEEPQSPQSPKVDSK